MSDRKIPPHILHVEFFSFPFFLLWTKLDDNFDNSLDRDMWFGYLSRIEQFEKRVLLTALLIKSKDNRQLGRDRELMSAK